MKNHILMDFYETAAYEIFLQIYICGKSVKKVPVDVHRQCLLFHCFTGNSNRGFRLHRQSAQNQYGH